MTDSDHSKETPEDTEELKRRWAKVLEDMPVGSGGDGGSPSLGGRVFAVILLLLVAPSLLFLGRCGASDLATIFGPVTLGMFLAIAFVSYKGTLSLWRGDSSGMGWVLAMVLLALISGAIYLLGKQPLHLNM